MNTLLVLAAIWTVWWFLKAELRDFGERQEQKVIDRRYFAEWDRREAERMAPQPRDAGGRFAQK